jgi:hypothetical protein
VPLAPGTRMRSQVCTSEVVVIQAPAEEIDLRCGGEPMVEISAVTSAGKAPAVGYDTGTLLGKRYTSDDDLGLEVLATRAGAGTLAVGDNRLAVKEPKPLPASD